MHMNTRMTGKDSVKNHFLKKKISTVSPDAWGSIFPDHSDQAKRS